MSLFATLQVALRALTVNRLRSSLTMLGIIIGVAAVITMIAVGRGAQARVEEQITSLGSNLIIVISGSAFSGGVRQGGGSGLSLSEEDAAAIEVELPHVLTAPGLRGTAQIVAGNQNWSSPVWGVTPSYHAAREWNVIAGRPLDEVDVTGSAKVAIIGQTVARSLFGDSDPLEQTVRIRKVPFTVIGVLARKGQSLQGQDQDDVVLVPITTARSKVIGAQAQAKQRAVNLIWVKAASSFDTKLAEAQVREVLRARHRLQTAQDDDFYLRNLQEVLSAQEASSRILALLLAAVASVSLLVGGIGIMNIMLVSVTERTREIGLRMAVGARGRDILTQFLIEAVSLSLAGGLVGILLGVGGSLAIGRFAGWRMELSPWAILLAVGFAAAVGIFFGFYPAKKASRLAPIEALRWE